MNEFDFVMANSERFKPGTWIAVVDEFVIEGKTAEEVFEKAKQKFPKKEPYIMKIPKNLVMLL